MRGIACLAISCGKISPRFSLGDELLIPPHPFQCQLCSVKVEASGSCVLARVGSVSLILGLDRDREGDCELRQGESCESDHSLPLLRQYRWRDAQPIWPPCIMNLHFEMATANS